MFSKKMECDLSNIRKHDFIVSTSFLVISNRIYFWCFTIGKISNCCANKNI